MKPLNTTAWFFSPRTNGRSVFWKALKDAKEKQNTLKGSISNHQTDLIWIEEVVSYDSKKPIVIENNAPQ